MKEWKPPILMSCFVLEWAITLLFGVTVQPLAATNSGASQRPHIIYIMGDDVGWDDVSFHGSRQIPTPNLDALAWDGVLLNGYYAQPMCSPSRAALLTGLYPIRYGLQGSAYMPPEEGLPLQLAMLPEHLKNLGYINHMVGKWHLGHSSWNHTPTMRGFDSFLGYVTGTQDYYTHVFELLGMCGFDFWFNRQLLWNASGTYTTHLLTQRAVSVINQHDVSKPLFLYIAHQAAHGINIKGHLQAPMKNIKKFSHIKNEERRLLAAVVDTLDESVGTVVEALHAKGMLANAILIYTSDNGAMYQGVMSNRGSNWPLRGTKFTAWEGGVHLPAFVWSPLLRRTRRVSWELMHVVDWAPTLYHAAGGDVKDLGVIDGLDQWEALSLGNPSPRQELLINHDPTKRAGTALRVGKYKLVVGTLHNGTLDAHVNTRSDQDTPTNTDLDEVMENSAVGRTLRKYYRVSQLPIQQGWRKEAVIDCGKDSTTNFKSFRESYLFDIANDPCELRDISQEEPKILQHMMERLRHYESVAGPPKEDLLDYRGFPERNNCTWSPWVGKRSSPLTRCSHESIASLARAMLERP
ncbi:arylsulfatase B-like [Dermacentor andersoni]|uniref:arylsulfatase B-like n=1 Tax=Dermacentor andersoni TaxID=34620 RepID=UPI003B3BCA7C